MLEVDISTGTSKFLHQAQAVGHVVTAEDIARNRKSRSKGMIATRDARYPDHFYRFRPNAHNSDLLYALDHRAAARQSP